MKRLRKLWRSLMSGNKWQPLLSICCLGYNHGAFIKDNINAIWKSKYKNIEIIVVDDGSSDDSAEILKEMQAKSPVPMDVIIQKNTGNIGYNFNEGIAKAKGDFIAFISLDDIFVEESIEKCMNILSKDKNIAFVAASKITAIDNNGKICTNAVPPLELDTMNNPTVHDLLELEYKSFGSFYIQGVFFNKTVIDAIKGFDEDMIGDDIVLRTKIFRYMIQNPQWRFVIIKEPTCCYRRHDSNISLNSLRQIKIVTEYLQRYWAERENPQILIDWTLFTIYKLSFADALAVFSINGRAAQMLKNQQIVDALTDILVSEKNENNIFRFIYSKKKKGNKVTIKFLSCLKFSYKKGKK